MYDINGISTVYWNAMPLSDTLLYLYDYNYDVNDGWLKAEVFQVVWRDANRAVLSLVDLLPASSCFWNPRMYEFPDKNEDDAFERPWWKRRCDFWIICVLFGTFSFFVFFNMVCIGGGGWGVYLGRRAKSISFVVFFFSSIHWWAFLNSLFCELLIERCCLPIPGYERLGVIAIIFRLKGKDIVCVERWRDSMANAID